MSTPCIITVKEKEYYKSVYCHSDGYPKHTGKMLLDYYNSEEKALSIVNLGDLSFLDKSVECPKDHSFVNRVEGYSVFYGRDRGEKNTSAEISFFNPYNKDDGYNYLWKNGKWYLNGKELEKYFE